MGAFKVQIPNLRGILESTEPLEGLLRQTAAEVQSVKRNLRVQIRQRQQLDNRLRSCSQQLETQSQALRRIVRVGCQAVSFYQDTEQKALGVTWSKPAHTQGLASWLQQEYEALNETPKGKVTFWDMLKTYLTILDKSKLDPAAGLGKSLLSYLESFGGFFLGDMTGATGLKNLCDLGDSSSSLWSALYSYFGKHDPTKTSHSLGQFTERWGNINGAVGTLGSGLGLIGAWVSALDGWKDKSGAERFASVLDTGGDMGSVVESAYDWSKWRDLDTPELLSAAKKYVILADTTCSSIAQLVRSVEQYSQDGTYDATDFGATGIDVGVKGLHTMISGLVSAVSFGTVDIEKWSGVTAEDISTGIKDWAGDWGQRAGNYINNDPELSKAYQKGNGLTKFALTCWAISSVGPIKPKVTLGGGGAW